MKLRVYKVLDATAIRTLETLVNDALAQGCDCTGGIYGSEAQGFKQSMVCSMEIDDEESDESAD